MSASHRKIWIELIKSLSIVGLILAWAIEGQARPNVEASGQANKTYVPVSIGPASLPSGKAGEPYQVDFQVNGGDGKYAIVVFLDGQNELPDGLEIKVPPNSETPPSIEGTPVRSGSCTIRVRVLDNAGYKIDKNYTLHITPPDPIVIQEEDLPSCTYESPYNVDLHASGGTGGYTWAVKSGTLPLGLSVSSDGVITGVPVYLDLGQSSFSIQVEDEGGVTASRSYSMKPSINENPDFYRSGIVFPEILNDYDTGSGYQSASFGGGQAASGVNFSRAPLQRLPLHNYGPVGGHTVTDYSRKKIFGRCKVTAKAAAGIAKNMANGDLTGFDTNLGKGRASWFLTKGNPYLGKPKGTIKVNTVLHMPVKYVVYTTEELERYKSRIMADPKLRYRHCPSIPHCKEALSVMASS